MRTFDTGATRDNDTTKPDYEGFLSPLVLECFANYMNKHRKQADGNLRSSDNWQKGIPRDAYMKSAWRHFMDVWKEHRGVATKDGLEEALCALLFNVQGYLFEYLRAPSLRDLRDVLAAAHPVHPEHLSAIASEKDKWLRKIKSPGKLRK